MKKTKKLSLIAAAALGGVASMAVVACTPTDDGHVHEYSWTISEAPTQDAGGKATGVCSVDGVTTEMDIPALSDTGFWTVNAVDPTHTDKGYTAYTNSTYKIECKVDGAAALGHTWGSWSVKQGSAPDATKGGTAIRLCTSNDGGSEETALNSLLDASWVKQDADYEAPTKNAPGKIVYKNTTLNFTYEITLAKLDDTSFWTVDTAASTTPTHADPGVTVYKNAAFALTVNVTEAALGHDWGAWTVDPDNVPTTSAPGVAKRVCTADDGGVETMPLPKLEEGEFWSLSHVSADYNTAGHDLWTAKNADLGIKIKNYTAGEDKLVAPYDSKTYIAHDMDIKPTSGAVGGPSWTSANVTLDAVAEGTGSAHPFRGKNKVTMVDAATGKVKYSVDDKEYIGYVDMNKTDEVYNNGIIVLSPDVEFKNILVLIPGDGTWTGVTSTGSCWTEQGGAFAITVTTSAKTTNIFVYKGKVYFDVSFVAADKTTAIAAADCYSADHVLVKSKSDDRIVAFAKSADGLKETDGNEGTYTGTITVPYKDDQGAWQQTDVSATAVLDGIGGITVTTVDGTESGRYVVEPEAGVLFGVYLNADDGEGNVVKDAVYYEITEVTDATFTGNMPMVTLTMHDVEGAGGGAVSNKVNKNIAIDFSGMSEPGFIGIYTDSAYTNKLTGPYIPTEDAELYARWSDKYIEYYDEGDVEATRAYYVAGDKIGDVLPKNEDDYFRRKRFLGWSTAQGDKEKIIDAATKLTDTNAGKITLYAVWEDFADYVGDYNGKLSDGTIESANKIEMKIDFGGNISGKIYQRGNSSDVKYTFTGKVIEYNKTDGVVIWQPTGTSFTLTMLIDAQSRMLAMAANSNGAVDVNGIEPGKYYYIISDSDITAESNFSFDFYNGVAHTSKETIITEFNNGAMAVVYGNKLYGNISATDHLGNTVTVESLKDKNGSVRIIIIKSAQNDTIVAFGTTAERFGNSKDVDGKTAVLKALDGLQGVYTYNGVQYTLDGMGNISWDNSEWAVYTSTGEGNFDVYERNRLRKVAPSTGGDVGSGDWEEEGDWGDVGGDDDQIVTYVYSYTNKAYYTMTIASGAITEFTQPMVTVTYAIGTAYAEVGTNETTSSSFNKNIYNTLVTPGPSDTHVFSGWYTDAACTTPVVLTDGKYMPTANVTLHSKWEEKAGVLSVYYVVDGQDATLNKSISLKQSETIDLSDCTNDGYAVVGYFSDAACTQPFTATSINSDTSVYIKWRVKQEYEGSYKTAYLSSYIYGLNFSDSTITIQNGGAETIELTDVAATDIVYLPFSSHTDKVTDSSAVKNQREYTVNLVFDPDTKELTFNIHAKKGNYQGVITETDSTFYGWFDPDTKIILACYSKDVKSVANGLCLFMPTDYSNSDGNVITGWNYRHVLYDYIDAEGVTHTLYVRKANDDEEQLVLTDCTIKNADGVQISAKTARTTSYIEIFNNKTPGAEPMKFVQSGNYFVTPGPENGTYTSSGKDDIFLNGAGAVTWGTKTGTYEAVSGQADKWYLKIEKNGSTTQKERYIMTVTGNTYTLAEDKVTITFVSAHGTAPAPVSTWRGVSYTLPTEELTETGYKFRYWYTTNESKSETSVPATEDNTVVTAKWDPQVTVTYHYNAGGAHPDATDDETLFAGDSIKNFNAVDFEYDGKAFAGWFTKDGTESGDWGDEFLANSKVSADMDLYAKWVVPHALAGTYKGFEFDSASLSTSVRTTVIDALGLATATGGSGTFSKAAVDYNKDTGYFTFGGASGRYGYYDDVSKTIVYRYGTSSESKLNNDVFVCTLADNVSVSSSDYVYWSDKSLTVEYVKLGKFTVDGTPKYFFVYNNKVYGDVTVSAIKNGQPVTSMSAFKTAGVLLTISRGNTELFKRLYDGTTFIASDGLAATYTGYYGNLVVDGYGSVTVGDSGAVAYTVLDKDTKKISFVNSNRMYIVTLGDDNTYAKEQDGYQGIYTLPDGAGTITLDGYGVADSNKTYVVNGAQITIYTGDGSVTYGIDVENQTLAGKSAFAGQTYYGTYTADGYDANVKIVFDDAASITGQLLIKEEDYAAYRNCAYNISAVLNGNTLTVTVDSTASVSGYNSSLSSAVGKTFTMEYNSSASPATLKFTSDQKLGYVSSNLKNVVTKVQ